MMKCRLLSLAFLAAFTVAASPYVYIGSFTVDDGPSWNPTPAAYSGQDAAALIFGGLAGDYAISTVDNDPLHINFSAWYSTFGGDPANCPGIFPCGTVHAQNYARNSDGLYANTGDVSAYVADWALGPDYTNYVFRAPAPIDGHIPTPEPGAWMLVASGAALLFLRRKAR